MPGKTDMVACRYGSGLAEPMTPADAMATANAGDGRMDTSQVAEAFTNSGQFNRPTEIAAMTGLDMLHWEKLKKTARGSHAIH